MATLLFTTQKHDRAIAAAERAQVAFDLALAADFADDARNEDEADAYVELLDTLPTSIEGMAAIFSALAHQQQALLSDDDEPELVSPFRTDADAFLFIQTLDEAPQRMLAERDEGAPMMALVEPEPRLIDGAAVQRVMELA